MSNDGTTALNSYLQAKDQANLLSWDEDKSGPQHKPTWVCKCKIDGIEFGVGTGPLKQVARAAAAKSALQRLIETDSQAEAAVKDGGNTHGEQ